MGAGLLAEKFGVDPDTVVGALTSLLGGADGQVDFGALASKMASSGELGSLVSSWLGDGANDAISPQQILGLFGQGSIDRFAGEIGTDPDRASQGLADVLPQMLDAGSSGGSLLDAVGGASGLAGLAKGLFD